ncbi:MAG: hypothetical protein Kow00105_19260 [Phycisphaeraceae bacterium]
MQALSRLVSWVGNFHPAVVHFPIALLLAGLLAEAIAWTTGRESYQMAGRYCAVLGAWSALLAVGLGWCMAGFHWIDEDWPLMTRHRWIGSATAAGALTLLCLMPTPGRLLSSRTANRAYRFVLIVTAVLVGISAYLGGLLVWGPDHLAW